MVQEPKAPGWMVIPLVFWLIVAVELSLCWHTDTYRTVSHGHGAFELCLPSLGNPYQIELLRSRILGRTLESNRSSAMVTT